MKIKWLGHSSFLITTSNGTKIVTDPYKAGSGLAYAEVKEAPDIVTVSHEHFDHNNTASLGGKPEVVKGAGAKEVKKIKILGIATFHDATGGKERGTNTIFCMDTDGMRICHMGDLGHPLTDKEVTQMGKVDIMLMPVGGFYTVDAKVATDVMNKVAPKVTIPMHFKNEKCTFPISGVEEFIKGKKNVSQPNSSEVEFKSAPANQQIIVLKPAL